MTWSVFEAFCIINVKICKEDEDRDNKIIGSSIFYNPFANKIHKYT